MRLRPVSSVTKAGGAYVLGGAKRCPQASDPFFSGGGPVAAAGRRRGAGREARAVTARNACASMDKVACRYQAPYLRTW
jgi:hypothetical protein